MLATVTCPLASTTTPVFTNPSSTEEFPVTVSTIFEYIRYVPSSNLMSYLVLSGGVDGSVCPTRCRRGPACTGARRSRSGLPRREARPGQEQRRFHFPIAVSCQFPRFVVVTASEKTFHRKFRLAPISKFSPPPMLESPTYIVVGECMQL